MTVGTVWDHLRTSSIHLFGLQVVDVILLYTAMVEALFYFSYLFHWLHTYMHDFKLPKYAFYWLHCSVRTLMLFCWALIFLKHANISLMYKVLYRWGSNYLVWGLNLKLHSLVPVSVFKKDISDHNYQSIYNSLWFYNSGFGCKNSLKMSTFRLIMRILWHNALLLEQLKPEND